MSLETGFLQTLYDNLYQFTINELYPEENSCRYTNEGGFCEITLYRTKQTAMITFQDSPPSVPAAALPKLFERLYRVEKSRSRELGGAGLGLTICKNIVEAHGGTILAYQSQYGGLAIQVELPLLIN